MGPENVHCLVLACCTLYVDFKTSGIWCTLSGRFAEYDSQFVQASHDTNLVARKIVILVVAVSPSRSSIGSCYFSHLASGEYPRSVSD
jgi:hypothetical protein